MTWAGRDPALIAALLAMVCGASGCGSQNGDAGGELRWVGQPTILRSPAIPRDRVLRGTLRNEGLAPLVIEAAELRLIDSSGRRVPGVATFAAGYVHGIYPPGEREPKVLSEAEQQRLGRKVRLRPGGRATLTLAWRQLPGRKPPVSISYGRGTLSLPPAARR